MWEVRNGNTGLSLLYHLVHIELISSTQKAKDFRHKINELKEDFCAEYVISTCVNPKALIKEK